MHALSRIVMHVMHCDPMHVFMMLQCTMHSAMQVYLPMSYIYGLRATCKETPLTAALRTELYPMPYDSIDWNAARNQIAKEDLYYPHPMIQVRSMRVLTAYSSSKQSSRTLL